MLISSPNLKLIDDLQKDLGKTFEMKNLDDAKRILGMDITRDRNESKILLNQRTYILSILKKISMENSKPVSVPLVVHFQLCRDQSPKNDFEKEKMSKVPYSNVIGSIMFLMVCSQPDIIYAISCLNRYMSNPGPPHWEALKCLLRYVRGSIDIGITFSKFSDNIQLIGYVDSNYANNRDSRNWNSQLQHIVALSTTEAEYIATTEAFKEAIWTKHIDVRHHFIRDIVVKELIKLEKIKTDNNQVDMGTHRGRRGNDEYTRFPTPDL
ncbi:UNVERIFIED_CONTAM: Retrovirus-related Pol polyprotein from transposon TNT 1-94 [Sesamum indicum]